MKLTTPSAVPVYTVAGASTARPLPTWLARKRRRSLKQDAEYAHRVELLQDFEFEEASTCVRVSEDTDWLMSTGTYKPQIHVHSLPQLSLSYARHTNALNQTFLMLSSDYSKSLHLQSDRSLEFHTPSGLHYSTRIPRYGRDLAYSRRTAEALVPCVGVNADGNGEVFRLNLEVGRFMKSFEVDVGGDDLESLGGGALQGGIRAGAVNCTAVGERSHGLLAFGTSLGTVEFWDSRSRDRVSTLPPPTSPFDTGQDSRPEITALEFHYAGLNLATGTSTGVVHTYDLRSPLPLLRKEQGYDSPIVTLKYLSRASATSRSISGEKLLSADKKCIKLFDSNSGDLWTTVEPAVDLNHVEWVPDSGMLLTANEGSQQHSFFIPQLGPAPRWCSFLDNLVEEMAEDANDPNSFQASNSGIGDVYDNYKFLDLKQLRDLSLDHLVGHTNLLRPYMHGYFVAQKLYEQARLLINPDIIIQQRQKSIQERIDKERDSRIRGNKKVSVKVNTKLAEKLAAREEANEQRKALRVLRRGGDDSELHTDNPNAVIDGSVGKGSRGGEKAAKKSTTDLMADDRFKRLFQDEDFEIDETSREFQLHNPSSVLPAVHNGGMKKRGLTAVEEEDIGDVRGSSDDDTNSRESDEDDEADLAALRARQRTKDVESDGGKHRIGSASYKKSGHRPRQQTGNGMKMQVSSSTNAFKKQRERQSKSFGDLASSLPSHSNGSAGAGAKRDVAGEKEISFAPSNHAKKRPQPQIQPEDGRKVARGKERRSASGNVFRRM